MRPIPLGPFLAAFLVVEACFAGTSRRSGGSSGSGGFAAEFADETATPISCDSPEGERYRYVDDPADTRGNFRKECVSLVKKYCPGTQGHYTREWRPGKWVMGNCNNLPRFTAIASFLGSNGRYAGNSGNGHAAIFLSCNRSGIEVYDQWNGDDPQVSGRKAVNNIRFKAVGGRPPSFDANNYYTIRMED